MVTERWETIATLVIDLEEICLITGMLRFCIHGSTRLELFFLFGTLLHVLQLYWTCTVDMLVTVNRSFYTVGSTFKA